MRRGLGHAGDQRTAMAGFIGIQSIGAPRRALITG